MRSNTYTRAAAVAATLLASGVSAGGFSASSSSNVAVYWGQGYAQIDLSEVCSDDSVDIVNVAFVNQFPKKVGDYPSTNFANACGSDYFKYPNGTTSGLLSNCPGINPGIKKCQENGKKVLLSVGGGWPTDYYLESKEIAEYFAEFLWGAFGPQTDAWVNAGKPRPFGDAAVDGFDLDIESWMEVAPFEGYQYKNYDKLVTHLKDISSQAALISAAPQCIVPDVRLADAIAGSKFDFIFVQFYNTPECSARAGYNGLSTATTAFTFDAWVAWLKANSKNSGAKLYLGLPAGEAGAPSDTESYLTPKEANKLVSFYQAKYPEIFGGVMLWEATVSARNTICDKPYADWIKDILVGSYSAPVCSSSSSSVASSTTSSVVSSTISSSATATPTGGKSPDGSCGGEKGYTCVGYHMGECCSPYGYCGGSSDYCDAGCQSSFGKCNSASSSSSSASSTGASSTSTSASASSTSSSVISSSTSSAVSSSSSSVVSSSASASSSSKVYDTTSSSLSASSSAVSSSSSVYPTESSSTKVYSTESSSTKAYPTESSSTKEYPTESSSTKVYPTESSSTKVYPTESSSKVYPTESSSSTPCSTSSPVYPTASSSSTDMYPTVPYPTGSNSTGVYPTSYSTSTPCTTSTEVYPTESSSSSEYPESPASSSTPCSSSTEAYPTESSSSSEYPEYPASSSTEAYPTESSSSSEYPEYPASSSTPCSTSEETHPTSSTKGYDEYPVPSSSSSKTYPSVTEKPSHSSYPPVETETVTTYTTTYVDVCPTGLITKTATITKTVCPKCTKPTSTPEVPEGWTTTVTVCTVCGPAYTTVTVTKPADKTDSYPAPTGPSYPEVPASSSPDAAEYPKPTGGAYVPETPEKEEYETVEATSTVYHVITLTKVPVPYTPAPYPEVNKTSVYVPSGTASSTGSYSYPTYSPEKFEGAASRLGVGMTVFAAIVAGLLAL